MNTNDFRMWDFTINCQFIPIYCFDNKLVNKKDFFRTKEDKRKVKLNFKVLDDE